MEIILFIILVVWVVFFIYKTEQNLRKPTEAEMYLIESTGRTAKLLEEFVKEWERIRDDKSLTKKQKNKLFKEQVIKLQRVL